MPTPQQADAEYVVVGSGAGGGTLAARLAEEGRTVVLLEAGSDSRACEDAGAKNCSVCGRPGAPSI